MGGKIIPRIRLTSAKDLVEVEAELGNTDSDIILIVFDRRVMIDKITVDRIQLMESLNFFGSNLGLWPGLGIFQISKWLLENLVWKINITKILKIIRKKINKE